MGSVCGGWKIVVCCFYFCLRNEKGRRRKGWYYFASRGKRGTPNGHTEEVSGK
jgi:hypothetical protein